MISIGEKVQIHIFLGHEILLCEKHPMMKINATGTEIRAPRALYQCVAIKKDEQQTPACRRARINKIYYIVCAYIECLCQVSERSNAEGMITKRPRSNLGAVGIYFWSPLVFSPTTCARRGNFLCASLFHNFLSPFMHSRTRASALWWTYRQLNIPSRNAAAHWRARAPISKALSLGRQKKITARSKWLIIGRYMHGSFSAATHIIQNGCTITIISGRCSPKSLPRRFSLSREMVSCVANEQWCAAVIRCSLHFEPGRECGGGRTPRCK